MDHLLRAPTLVPTLAAAQGSLVQALLAALTLVHSRQLLQPQAALTQHHLASPTLSAPMDHLLRAPTQDLDPVSPAQVLEVPTQVHLSQLPVAAPTQHRLVSLIP